MSRQPFWMVKGAGPTNHVHATEEAAVMEAARLAELNPGQEFHVLQSISTAVKTSVVWTMHDRRPERGDNVPF